MDGRPNCGVSQLARRLRLCRHCYLFYFDTVFRERERRPPCHSPPTPRARRSPRSRVRTAAPGGLMRCTAGTWSTSGNTQKISERSVSNEDENEFHIWWRVFIPSLQYPIGNQIRICLVFIIRFIGKGISLHKERWQSRRMRRKLTQEMNDRFNMPNRNRRI